MKALRGIKVLATVALISGVALTGCVVAPAPGYYGAGVVTVAPPEPRVEVVGVAPTVGWVWFPGYWEWSGGAHVWVSGHWGPGRPGYHWVPHHWERYGGGWRMVRGHWAR